MTETRWATRATMPRSWVISSMPRPRSRWSWASRRRIWACTVTSSAVVGSSAINSLGSHISAMAIMTRWRRPPESWCGNWPSLSPGAVMPTRARRSAARSLATRLARLPVAAQHLGHLRAHRVGGIEAGHRLLEDHGHGVAAQMRHAGVGEALQILALEGEPPGRASRAAGQQVHDGKRRHRLAAARFAHQAVGLAAFDGERGAAHRRYAAAETHFELLDLQQGAQGSVLAPNRSRRPSPRRLMPSTSTNSATPGMTITQGLKNM